MFCRIYHKVLKLQYLKVKILLTKHKTDFNIYYNKYIFELPCKLANLVRLRI